MANRIEFAFRQIVRAAARGSGPDAPRTQPARLGVTLFEVVLALAIFVGSIAAISEVLRTGNRASIRAQFTSDALIRCERKLNEILAGIVPLQSVSQQPFEDDQAWVWTFNLTQTQTPGLLRGEMIVERVEPRAGVTAKVQLARFHRDPQIYLDAAALAAARAAQEKTP